MTWKISIDGREVASVREVDELIQNSTIGSIIRIMSSLDSSILYHYLKMFIGYRGYQAAGDEFFAGASNEAKLAIAWLMDNLDQLIREIDRKRESREAFTGVGDFEDQHLIGLCELAISRGMEFVRVQDALSVRMQVELKDSMDAARGVPGA